MTRKAARTKNRAVPRARPKRQTARKRAKARWHEEAVIHQDLFFAEAPTQ
jgi:hypothetical protein